MVQLEVKLRIKHERGNKRRRWRKRDGVVQAARGERDRKEGEWGREEGRVSPCSPIRGQNID